jgi:5'-3' exonuclease
MVLLVDGDNLLTIGFYGVKNAFHKGVHIGGIYHFLNTLRKTFETYHLDKIVVFWDGNDGSRQRKLIYERYKQDRGDHNRSEEEQNNFDYQRYRIKQYLEEVYVRQGEYEFCESDDCISYYVQNSPNEKKIIFSSDGDLTQLISPNTQLYHPMHHVLYSEGDTILYKKEEMLVDNVRIAKVFCGDPSDSIAGISGLGIKRLLALFPELKTRKMNINEIMEQSNVIFERDKRNNTINNILSGVTKYGTFGDEFLELNEKIVILDHPLLTDEAKDEIELLINDTLSTEGRSYKNCMKMMMEDGIFNLLPKSDSAWINFLNPFLRLTRKEKNKKTIINIRNYE